jgi:hypothetical protein
MDRKNELDIFRENMINEIQEKKRKELFIFQKGRKKTKQDKAKLLQKYFTI